MDHSTHASHGSQESEGSRGADGSHEPRGAHELRRHAPYPRAQRNANWIAFTATVHCLTGCAIGEILGMVVGTALGLGNVTTTVVAIVLAFAFGYLLTTLPLLRAGMERGAAVRLALAADTASIALMEVVDNALMWFIPGAMDAGLDTALFWGSLAVSLVLAGLAAWPLNRWLISRGRGHAVVHSAHGHHHSG